MRLYFVRHGQSEANVRVIISNRDLLHSLTELGRQQAETLAERLMDVPVMAIYSSPIMRAVETAHILAQAKNLPVEITKALCEPDCGVMEGRADEEAWAEHDRVMHDWMVYQRFDSCIAGGESYNDLRARFVPFIERLVAAHVNSAHNILLITHGSLLYLMLPLVLANLDSTAMVDLPMPNTGVIIVEQRASGLVCLEWCGVKISE